MKPVLRGGDGDEGRGGDAKPGKTIGCEAASGEAVRNAVLGDDDGDEVTSRGRVAAGASPCGNVDCVDADAGACTGNWTLEVCRDEEGALMDVPAFCNVGSCITHDGYRTFDGCSAAEYATDVSDSCTAASRIDNAGDATIGGCKAVEDVLGDMPGIFTNVFRVDLDGLLTIVVGGGDFHAKVGIWPKDDGVTACAFRSF